METLKNKSWLLVQLLKIIYVMLFKNSLYPPTVWFWRGQGDGMSGWRPFFGKVLAFQVIFSTQYNKAKLEKKKEKTILRNCLMISDNHWKQTAHPRDGGKVTTMGQKTVNGISKTGFKVITRQLCSYWHPRHRETGKLSRWRSARCQTRGHHPGEE